MGILTLVVGLLVATFASASHVEPELIPGAPNRTCAELQGPGQSWLELKVDPNGDGTFTQGPLTVTISNTQNDKTFDWSSNIGVDAVFVKAGAAGSNLYRYDPPEEETADTGLTSPGGGTSNAISHIAFCYDLEPTGELTVIKRVVNDDGGTAQPGNWTMNVSGPTDLSFPGASDPGTTNEVDVGSYQVTESGPSGYTLTYSGDCDAQGNVTVGADESKTCILTNDDQGASLTVIKHVVNDDGGTAVAGDWTMNVAGPTALSFPGAEAPGTTNPVDAGSYQVTESGGASGYALTYSGDCDAQGNVSLAPGESKTCTLTNDDQAASLTVIKHVVSDDGGTAVAGDWTMNVAGPTALSFAGAEAPGTTNPVDAGDYTITESGGPSGYALTYSGDCDAQGSVSLALGESKTCTLTNDDEPASLTVIKHVVNDDGGSAVASDWTMNVSGPTGLSFPGAEAPGTTNPVDAGDYEITESGPAGYVLSYSGDCDAEGNVSLEPGEEKTCTLTNDDGATSLTVVKRVVADDGGTGVAADWTMSVAGPTNLSFPGAEDPGTTNAVDPGSYQVTESGGPSGYALTYSGDCDAQGNVSLELGDAKTCILTNDDQPASLTVIKHVVSDDGGTAVAGDWTMNVAGPTPLSFPGAEAPGTTNAVDAGSYQVTESGPSGYALTYSGDCDANGNVSLALGESKTCTLTNDDVVQIQGQGSIDVQKSATPTSMKEPGGPVTFSVRITNTSNVLVTITDVVDNVFGDLDDSGGNGCFDVPINLDPGTFATCQFVAPVTGPAGTVHVNTVTASGHDAFGNPVSDSDDARVEITPLLIDLVIVKEATSPTPLNGIVNYTMTVTNRGPDPATNVQLADPAPAGITYLTATPSQGTCSVTPSLVTCSLGTINPGQVVTIAVTARATAVGTHVNTATVTGSGGRETNPADNTDSAQTVVPAPLTPPTPRPRPPATGGEICLSLTVTPKMITADGKPDRVRAVVRAATRPMRNARVLIRGAGIRKAGRTNARGVAVITINPRRVGLITITTLERQRSCGARRIGVVGVFLPPVTG